MWIAVATIAAIALLAGVAGAALGHVPAAIAETVVPRAATADAPPVNDGLPMPGFEIDPSNTAIVITDPQNDFLSPNGVTWGVVGQSITENRTVENLGALFEVADETGMPVFVSPHYYYEHDHVWKFEGTLEKLMHNISMFDRGDQLNVKGFEGSGADWLPRYKKYIKKDRVVVTSPHKVFGPESNDLALQLRKQKIDKVILAGMSGNLCAESHMRDLIEAGFEVAVVGDATGSAKLPGLDGNQAAQTNYKMVSSKVFTTQELEQLLNK